MDRKSIRKKGIRVAVGFEEKVYMAVEGEVHLVIPVVVKESQLTEKVVLHVTTEDRTTTGMHTALNIPA